MTPVNPVHRKSSSYPDTGYCYLEYPQEPTAIIEIASLGTHVFLATRGFSCISRVPSLNPWTPISDRCSSRFARIQECRCGNERDPSFFKKKLSGETPFLASINISNLINRRQINLQSTWIMPFFHLGPWLPRLLPNIPPSPTPTRPKQRNQFFFPI